VYAFSADHRQQLFPPELFDVTRQGGGTIGPAEVIATVMVLQTLEGLSDRCPRWRPGWGADADRGARAVELGVRFRQEPRGLRRHVVAAGSPADGCRIGDLDVGEDVWISFVIRNDQLVPVGGATSLRAGDEILALTDPERGPDLTPIFSKPGTGPAPA
jgi:TrkA-C domain